MLGLLRKKTKPAESTPTKPGPTPILRSASSRSSSSPASVSSGSSSSSAERKVGHGFVVALACRQPPPCHTCSCALFALLYH